MRAVATVPSSLIAAHSESGLSGTVHRAGWCSTTGGSSAAAWPAPRSRSTNAGASTFLIRPSDRRILPEGRGRRHGIEGGTGSVHFQDRVLRYVSPFVVLRTISIVHDCVPSLQSISAGVW